LTINFLEQLKDIKPVLFLNGLKNSTPNYLG